MAAPRGDRARRQRDRRRRLGRRTACSPTSCAPGRPASAPELRRPRRRPARGSTCSSRCGAISSTPRRWRAAATLPAGLNFGPGRRAGRPRRRADGVRRPPPGSDLGGDAPRSRLDGAAERPEFEETGELTLDSRLAAERARLEQRPRLADRGHADARVVSPASCGRAPRRADRPPAGRLLRNRREHSVTERRAHAERALAARHRRLPRLRRAGARVDPRSRPPAARQRAAAAARRA